MVQPHRPLFCFGEPFFDIFVGLSVEGGAGLLNVRVRGCRGAARMRAS
jgi:hypothetical protein